MTEHVDGMITGQDRVFVKHGGIHVFSLADGTLQATLGNW